MADSIPLTGPIDLTSAPQARPLVLEVLHDWVTTVDHKKIGLMYIGYALVFLRDRGAWKPCLIRAATRYSAEQPGLAAGVQSPVHDARNDDGLLRRHADSFRLRELSDPADAGCARHGVPATERFQLLDIGLRRAASVLQFSWGRRPLRRRHRAGCRLVCLCSVDGEGLLSRP